MISKMKWILCWLTYMWWGTRLCSLCIFWTRCWRNGYLLYCRYDCCVWNWSLWRGHVCSICVIVFRITSSSSKERSPHVVVFFTQKSLSNLNIWYGAKLSVTWFLSMDLPYHAGNVSSIASKSILKARNSSFM